MKVLLAIDTSKTSHVVQMAASRPWPADTMFCVISVIDMRHWEGLPALIEDAKHEAESVVKRATNELAKTGHRVFSEIREGSPKEIITGQAKQWSADLVMVGSHGLGLATRFLLGSVAQAVLRTAPCSVEIVRKELPSRGARILLATDGSEVSAKAVSEIAKRPWPEKSEVRIVSAVRLLTTDVPSLTSSFQTPMPNVVDEVTRLGKSRAEQAVAQARKALTPSGLEISAATPLGDPRPVILDEAETWAADLIVLGSHGLHGIDRFLLGSVAESVATHAACSVEVVR